MVEKRLALEPEVQEIFSIIDQEGNFLLSGGAGSGKTYSLVQVIMQVIRENPTAKIACMTYTNAAVKEIEERINHANLNVTTIHDFLWDNIKHFQKELKAALITLCNDETVTAISLDEHTPLAINFFDTCEEGIQYKEFLRLKEGIISHDEVLIVATHLFGKYPKLSNVVKDKYPFILIDEYQDTSKEVIDIFLTHFDLSKRKNIIGFFGDAMQSIYDDTIGNLNEYRHCIREVKKHQNRRSPQKVIDLANKLRTDGIVQVPSTDTNAPNMNQGNLKQGRILFLHSALTGVKKAKEFLIREQTWNFTNSKETKELYLTHNLIADGAGFKNLMDIYDKDQVLAYRTRIKKYIQDTGINTDFSSNTFGEVIELLKQGKTETTLRPILPTAGMNDFIKARPDLMQIALASNYSELMKLYVHKDHLVDDKKNNASDEKKKGSKRDALIKHLFKIQTNIHLYQNHQYNEFLRVTDYRIHIQKIVDKQILKDNIENLINVGNKTIEQVILEAHEKRICIMEDKLDEFIADKSYLYNRVKDIQFSEFQSLYNFLEGKTPFSTQHKTKGSEFDNVLVIMDNG